MRSGIGWVHSNCAPESKKRHCLQQCNSAWHLGHVPLGSKPGVRTAPQLEQRARVTVPTMRGVRGPNWSAPRGPPAGGFFSRSEEHTSELQSLRHLVCRLLLEKKNIIFFNPHTVTRRRASKARES